MNWLEKLSDVHVKFATLFERVGRLAEEVERLNTELHAANLRVARLEGALAMSPNPEAMRQLADLQNRVASLEAASMYEAGLLDVTPKRRRSSKAPKSVIQIASK